MSSWRSSWGRPVGCAALSPSSCIFFEFGDSNSITLTSSQSRGPAARYLPYPPSYCYCCHCCTIGGMHFYFNSIIIISNVSSLYFLFLPSYRLSPREPSSLESWLVRSLVCPPMRRDCSICSRLAALVLRRRCISSPRRDWAPTPEL